jgi:signal transduction histidine kinase
MSPSILLVDDEDTILFAMREYFETEGYDVTCARDLLEAKAALAKRHYAAVIADLRLSGSESTEGLELVSYVRAHCATTRILVLTAYGSPAVEHEAHKRGVDVFIQKLTPLPQVARRVREVLGDEAAIAPHPTTPPVSSSSPPTILVIDDQEEALVSTRLLLEQEGYQVLTALGGQDALALFRPGEVHVVIVDYFMPRMNGEQLVQEIRKLDQNVQILLQTGYAGEKPPREMLRLLDIQGYHDKLDGPERLLLWVDVALKSARQLQKVHEAERQVLASRTQLRRLAARLFHVQEAEREELGRELHDHLGQLLTAAKMDVEWAQRGCSTTQSDLQERLHEASTSVQTAMVTMRSLSAALRPATFNRLGLSAAVREHVADCARRSGVAMQFSGNERDIPVLAKDTGMNVYRIVQEALTNVIRHATATRVTVKLWRTWDTLWVAIDDDGKGFSVPQAAQGAGLGLVGMQERARLIGGTLEISSTPRAGTTVLLAVPVSDSGDSHDYSTVS